MEGKDLQIYGVWGYHRTYTRAIVATGTSSCYFGRLAISI